LVPLKQGQTFCDGIAISRTPITASIAQVKSLFAKHNLRIWAVIPKVDSWFIKFDEDVIPKVEILKPKLKELFSSANQKLGA